MTPEPRGRSPTGAGGRLLPGRRAPGEARTWVALALGLLVLPVQLVLLLLWRAVADLPLVEALARLLGMTTSGLPGYFLLFGLGGVLVLLVSLGVTYGVAAALLRSGKRALTSLGSAVLVLLVGGAVVYGNRASRTEELSRRTEELDRRARERVETLASGTRVENLRVEPGPLYASVGATADNPRPEWGELRWSVRVTADLRVPAPGPYRLTLEYRLPGEDAGDDPHAGLETELVLREGTNALEVTLDANQTRGYQGFWDPGRSGGAVTIAVEREVSPAELYGDGAGALGRSAERLFGSALAPEATPRTVELLRERFEL